MDIALGMDAMLYFRELTEASFDHEETVELIVPDTLPDARKAAKARRSIVKR